MAAVAGEPTLRFGDINVNGWVAHLQERVAAVGFDPGPIDGMFFARTHEAVLGFQASRGLVVDGIVGQQTWGALNTAAPAVPPTPSPPGGGGGGAAASGVRFVQGPDFDQPSGGIFYVAENGGPTTRAAGSVHDTVTVTGPDGSVLFEQDFFNGDELAAGLSYGNQSIKAHNDEPGPHQVFVMLDEGRGESVSFEFTIGGPVGLRIEFIQGPDFNRPTGGIFYAAENQGPGTAAAGEIEDRVIVVGPSGSVTLDQSFFNPSEVGPQGNYGNESGPAHDGAQGTYVASVTLDGGRGDSRSFSFDIGSGETAPPDAGVPIDIDGFKDFFELP